MNRLDEKLLVVLVAVLCARTEAGPTQRIVGGQNAYTGQFPHQVSLRRGGSHTCGGSIISHNYILTAAHCVGTNDENGNYTTYSPSVFTIRVGSNDRFMGGIIVEVDEIIAHEDYGNFLNDIALMHLKEPLIYSTLIQPIKIASSEVPAGAEVIISGFGRLSHGGDVARVLQYNYVTAISQEDCKERIRWDSETLICLLKDAGNGACHGDSGGPAMYKNEVVGIAGFVVGGCGTANPDGYAKVYYHNDWIKKHSDVK